MDSLAKLREPAPLSMVRRRLFVPAELQDSSDLLSSASRRWKSAMLRRSAREALGVAAQHKDGPVVSRSTMPAGPSPARRRCHAGA